MKFWIITDMHLGHTKLVEDKLRPEGYSEKILKNLFRVVTINDILIDLGDICFEDCAMWHERLAMLPCKRWLIKGNHDSQSTSWYLGHGWSTVCDSLSLKMYGKNVLFSHIPLIDTGYDLNIHGHFHDFTMERIKEKEPQIYSILNPKHRLVSLEATHYQPMTLEYLCKDKK